MFDVTAATRRRVAAAVLAGALAVGACSSDDGASGGDDAVTGVDQAGAGGAEGSAGEGPFAVGRRSLTLVDATRTTDAVTGRLAERPERTIEVEVVYPAEGEAGPVPTDEEVVAGGVSVVDAPPAPDVFPLVVFAHGWNGRADHFRGFAERWAREGYVVALPTFPLSRAGIAVADLADQPGDISFVVDELAGLAADDPLAGHIDVERLAVGGHSLGAATTFGIAYNSCCLDGRIDAAIPVAGGSLPFEGGDYEDRPATPMLLVHGARDATVPVVAGDAMFEQARSPVWYLRPAEADHVTVFTGEPGRLFAEATVAFLDAHLGDDTTDALDAVGAEAVSGGVAEWRVKPPPG